MKWYSLFFLLLFTSVHLWGQPSQRDSVIVKDFYDTFFNRVSFDPPHQPMDFYSQHVSNNIAYVDLEEVSYDVSIKFHLDDKKNVDRFQADGLPEDLAEVVKNIFCRFTKYQWKDWASNGDYSLDFTLKLPGHYCILDNEPIYYIDCIPRIDPRNRGYNMSSYVHTIEDRLHCFYGAVYGWKGRVRVSFLLMSDGYPQAFITRLDFPYDVRTELFVEFESGQIRGQGHQGGLFNPLTHWKPVFLNGKPIDCSIVIDIDFETKLFNWKIFTEL